MLDIIGKRRYFFLISGIVIAAGLIAAFVFGLKPGIEFSSGSLLTLRFDNPVTNAELENSLGDLGYGEAIVQRTGSGDFIIRLPSITDTQKAELETGLTAALGTLTEQGFDSVSPMIASETTRNAGIAVGVSAIGMLLYIALAFRKMPNPFRWGVCAIAALAHDILVVIGVFALLGGIFGWQVDLMFVAGVLTVIGYSINDTIVVFDRIRENVRKSPGVDFEKVVNNSVLETLSRSLITGVGVIFVLIAMAVVVGAAIQNLVVVLLAGVITGTYSAIGTAASLLVAWEKRKKQPARA